MNIENEPNVIKIKEPVIIVGDIHGQFYDMIHMFEKVVDNRNLPKTNMLFLGDYVDRGAFSCEVRFRPRQERKDAAVHQM